MSIKYISPDSGKAITTLGNLTCADYGCTDEDMFVLPDGCVRCRECGEIVPHSDAARDAVTEDYVCEECLDNGDYAECDDCGEYFDQNLCGHVDTFRNTVCDSCYDRYDLVTCESCGEILRSNEYWYDDGIEIVTHPCTLDYHRCNFPWEKVIKTSRRYGFTSHNAGTCGLHVHVSREALALTGDTDATAAGRVIVLVDRLWDYLDRFSRRNGNHHWAARTHTPEAWVDAMSESEVLERVYALTGSSRYLALNTQNGETVEFRFNRGSLRYDTILASIELCHNLVTYAREHSLNEIVHATWEEVISIGTDDGSNAELLHYCESRMTGDYGPTELPEFHTPAPRVAAGYWVDYKGKLGIVVDGRLDAANRVTVSFEKRAAEDILSTLSKTCRDGIALEQLGLTNVLWVPVADLTPICRAEAPSEFLPGDVVIQTRRRGTYDGIYGGNLRDDLMHCMGVVIGKMHWPNTTYNTYWPTAGFNFGHDCGDVVIDCKGWNFETRELICIGHIDDVSKYLKSRA